MVRRSGSACIGLHVATVAMSGFSKLSYCSKEKRIFLFEAFFFNTIPRDLSMKWQDLKKPKVIFLEDSALFLTKELSFNSSPIIIISRQ